MIKIFIDFDGTITRQDVGDAMFETFGGETSLQAVDEYRQENISAVECFNKESAACGEFEKRALDNFLDAQEIDPTFIEFIKFCRERGIEHYIVSDGMDYYITHILQRYGLGDVPFFSNHMELVSFNGTSKVRFQPSFPFVDEVCDRCASCKRNHMLTLSGDEDIIVYVGEGYSDRCPVRYADAIFAKDDLLKYCQQENIPFFEYRTFDDVTKRLKMLIDGSNADKTVALRKRRQAELARREAFIGE
jgi:2-hydroxy-3-keto-5-methylthiopentenyl-1-phosphate phosphatase